MLLLKWPLLDRPIRIARIISLQHNSSAIHLRLCVVRWAALLLTLSSRTRKCVGLLEVLFDDGEWSICCENPQVLKFYPSWWWSSARPWFLSFIQHEKHFSFCILLSYLLLWDLNLAPNFTLGTAIIISATIMYTAEPLNWISPINISYFIILFWLLIYIYFLFVYVLINSFLLQYN